MVQLIFKQSFHHHRQEDTQVHHYSVDFLIFLYLTYSQIDSTKKLHRRSVDFCGTHVQERSKFHSKAFKYKYGIQFLNFFKLQYGAMGYLFDGGSNEKK